MRFFIHISVLILTIAICFVSPVYPQDADADISFDHLSIDKGLSQSSVLCILQDSEGYMWFGTQEGLNKYDGHNFEFEIYKHDLVDTNSLSDIWIYDIADDRKGNIWIATRNGLNKLEIKTRKFTRYFNNPNQNSSLNDNEVLGVYVDKQGYIWVKTSRALSKLNPKTNKFTNYDHYIDYFNSVQENRFPIYEDKDGILWVGTADGLNYFDRKYEQFTRLKHDAAISTSLSNNCVYAICEDKSGYLWIGTSDGLNRYDKKKKEFTRFYHSDNDPNSLINNKINSLFFDSNGRLWIGTDAGISVYHPKENKFSTYRTQANNPNSLSNEEVVSIYESKSKLLWIGTNGGGVDKVDMKNKKFHLYRKSPSFDISSDVIASIYLNDDGKLWVGTYGQGVNIIDRKTNEITHFYSNAGMQRIHDNYVHSIIKDSYGKLWLGTRNGVNIYDQATGNMGSLQDYIPATRRDLNIKNKRIYTLMEDRKKNVWISSEKGLFKINLITQEVTTYKYTFNDSLGICADRTQCITIDREGYVWIGTSGGLNKYNSVTNTFVQYKSKINCGNCLSHNSVYAVYEDSEGFLWVGTAGSGLNKFDKKTERFKYYTEKDGLPNGTIYEIEEDNNGDLWFSTAKGLARFNKKTETFTAFDTDDGLQSLEFNNGANFRSKEGELFFGGIQGFNSFFPDSIRYNLYIPRVVLTKFEKQNSEGKQIIFIEDKPEIEISYQDYSFTIYFAALEFTKPEKNSYSYMMENLKDEWVDAGSNNSVTFSNIPAGEYIFKVKGSNNDQVWNPEPTIVKIIISPPFWKTKWAYILYILVIILIIYSYIEFRTRKLRAANTALREKQLAALEIAKQKEELSIKNKSITDSINYAKRIQQAMMPSEYLFKKLLDDSFILYKPKDIVSGDFYWITEKNDKIFVAAVDCTGHGVPGAFMSIIGFDLLRNITKEQGIEDPAQILNQLNAGVAETFSKNTEDQSVKDGMDIALCVIDRNNNIVEYSGAFNPLYVIRDNKLITIRANRFSVGMVSDKTETQTFENHTIPVKENDALYIFSDGYPDQFGGPFGAKFKYSRFRQLLLTIHNLPMKKQKSFLEEHIDNWRGELEQVDDILVIGIKITK